MTGLPVSGEHLERLAGPAYNRPEWEALILSVVPFLLAGAAVAYGARASQVGSAVTLVAVTCSLVVGQFCIQFPIQYPSGSEEAGHRPTRHGPNRASAQLDMNPTCHRPKT